MKKLLLAASAAVLAVATLTACQNKYTEPFADAPRSGNDNSPALTVEMPDGFSNVATKCVGDVRITVAYHGDNKYGAVSTVVDPACKTGGN